MWLLAPILIFLVARVVSTVMVMWLGTWDISASGASRLNAPSGWSFQSLMVWDAHWYHRIVTEGYPSELPLASDGDVRQNQWAFYPLFPALTKVLTLLGIPFLAAASSVSLACGAAAMVVLFRLLAPTAGTFTALLSVTGFSFSVASLTLGAPYSESTSTLLVLLGLWAVVRDRPGVFVVVALALALARPVTPALAAVAGVVWLVRWWRRDRTPFPVRARVQWGSAAVASACAFLLWPAIAGVVTGQPDAYALTQQAWNHEPGWGTWVTAVFTGRSQGLLTVGVLAWAALLAWHARTWPLAVRLWTVLYPLFILGASRTTPSIVRYLLLAITPAWPFPQLSRDRSRPTQALMLTGVVLFGLGTQAWWIIWAWCSPGDAYP